MQAVEENGNEGSEDDFGGGVLHKRQRAAAQSQQSDGEAADLQQVRHADCQQQLNNCRQNRPICGILYDMFGCMGVCVMTSLLCAMSGGYSRPLNARLLSALLQVALDTCERPRSALATCACSRWTSTSEQMRLSMMTTAS